MNSNNTNEDDLNGVHDLELQPLRNRNQTKANIDYSEDSDSSDEEPQLLSQAQGHPLSSSSTTAAKKVVDKRTFSTKNKHLIYIMTVLLIAMFKAYQIWILTANIKRYRAQLESFHYLSNGALQSANQSLIGEKRTLLYVDLFTLIFAVLNTLHIYWTYYKACSTCPGKVTSFKRSGELSIEYLKQYSRQLYKNIVALKKAKRDFKNREKHLEGTTNLDFGGVEIKDLTPKMIQKAFIQLKIEKNSKRLYCFQCDKPRPARAHHCSQCQTCVLRMDHHCPWIGNCVGLNNLLPFFQFMVVTLIGFLGYQFTLVRYILSRRKIIGIHLQIICVFMILFALIFMVFINILVYELLDHAGMNTTNIEEIIDSPEMRKKFDKGNWLQNVEESLNGDGHGIKLTSTLSIFFLIFKL